MEVKEILCPSCGAHVKIKVGEPVVCEYCNSTLYVEDDNSAASVVDKKRLEELEMRAYQHRQAESEREALIEQTKKWKTLRRIFNIAYCIATFFVFILVNMNYTGAGVMIWLLTIMCAITESIINASRYPLDSNGRNVSGVKTNRGLVGVRILLSAIGWGMIGIVIAAIVSIS